MVDLLSTTEEGRTIIPALSLSFFPDCCSLYFLLQRSNFMDLIRGLHHLTACVGAAQEDVDFYTKIIGLRLVKQTVLLNGEKPVYHLYYANETGTPGTVMTTFPCACPAWR